MFEFDQPLVVTEHSESGTLKMKSVAVNFIKASRGDLSAINASIRCGFKGNQFSRWENGYSQALWSDMLDCLDLLNLPILKSMQIVVPTIQSENLTEYSQHLIKTAGKISCTKTLKISSSTFDRWKTGKKSPSLEEMLVIFEMNGVLYYFLKSLFGDQNVVKFFSKEFSLLKTRVES